MNVKYKQEAEELLKKFFWEIMDGKLQMSTNDQLSHIEAALEKAHEAGRKEGLTQAAKLLDDYPLFYDSATSREGSYEHAFNQGEDLIKKYVAIEIRAIGKAGDSGEK